MRPLHLLYKLLRKEYLYQSTQREKTSDGICTVMTNMFSGYKLDEDEYHFLTYHFKSQKPNLYKHPKFLNSKMFIGSTYWWRIDNPESTGERLRFLDLMVEITEREWDLEQRAIELKNNKPPREGVRMTLNQMYRIVKDTFLNRMETVEELKTESEGICLSILFMETVDIINEAEQKILFKHLNSNKPSIDVNPEFFYHSHYIGEDYWWNNNKKDKSNESRLRFLDKMIKITE